MKTKLYKPQAVIKVCHGQFHAVFVRHGAATGWIVFILILMVLLASGWIASQKLKGVSTVGSAGSTVVVRQGDLVITVTEGGSIRAHKSVEYRCQVESRGMGSGITILSIVPAGTLSL